MHDFGGFPPPLYALDYPAPGDPALAEAVLGRLRAQGWDAAPEPERPLDHGSWAVLRHLLPEADVPVVGLSLPRAAPRDLHRLGAALAPLREEGVLLLASGGLVHNLRAVAWEAPEGEAEPWAREAEAWLLERLEAGRLEELFDHRERWPGSRRAAPTTEHLDPLFVALGAAGGEPPRTVHEGWQMGNLSLRILAWD